MKNICRHNAIGKHFTAIVIQSTNQFAYIPFCKNVTISVILGTAKHTVKHCIAKVITSGCRTSPTVFFARYIASLDITKKIKIKTITYSIHISRIAIRKVEY